MRKSFGGLIRVAAFALPLLASASLRAVNWFPFGPDGGDARALAADPHDHKHVYLGTAVGWMYDSHDGGRTWKRLARLSNRDDLVIDNIVVDAAQPNVLFAGAWVLGSTDGGFYISRDAGKSWTEVPALHGQSIRSLSAAPSDPNTLVAGTLEGVFLSHDTGLTWSQISPVGSTELHEVESIAIDPKDPNAIYAGTWHLPWKTTDGGKHWKNIKQGIIDDSDVFSIIVHPTSPSTVYASACSGIYKSGNGGDSFTKIQGIPSTARRTRVLMQDPKHLETVYAGTTEGLWRTADGGTTWRRTTDPSTIVNDVFVDAENPDHVLLATDRSGVLVSDDGGFSFRPSNSGFAARQVTAYVGDSANPAKLYIGLINDKDSGGVFSSANGGLTWYQLSSGLNGLDVLALAQAPDGTIVAGTSHGIFRLQGVVWLPSSTIAGTAAVRTAPPAAPAKAVKGKRPVPVRRPVAVRPAGSARVLDAPVSSIVRSGNTMYATTTLGVLQSNDSGNTWLMTPLTGDDFRYSGAAPGGYVVVAGLHRIAYLNPATQQWTDTTFPNLTQIASISTDDKGRIWAGGREGIFRSNTGTSWQSIGDLRLADVNSIFYDDAGKRMLITANSATTLTYAVRLSDDHVSFWDTGWHLRLVRPVGDHLVGATLYDGIVVQPRMVESTLK
ncbi:beta propeller repeat protein [Terriglobus tenax]|uniref:hypothetical protein n=1 Tax=Terriglobus tenax TaxID=1111115 RepID=UPI0021DFA1D1|nr:hypothetical protein [Terriglobus tenax]